MTCSAWTLAAALLIIPLAGQESQGAASPTVSVQLIAVRATSQGHEKAQFDSNIAFIRETVEDLKQFDDFRKLKSVNTTAPYGKETKVLLDDRYTLLIHPIERDSLDRIRCDVRVQMRLPDNEAKPSTQPGQQAPSPRLKEVLRCTLLAVSGKSFKVGGLKLDEGQLVLVLTLTDERPAENP
ncbi:MAG TPA: hypothetical protein PLD73_10545 [Candidatus Hydrogenedentes bacterium]|nr:hypothetical protein [Candidatus Hydrogenedentota bacterium]